MSEENIDDSCVDNPSASSESDPSTSSNNPTSVSTELVQFVEQYEGYNGIAPNSQQVTTDTYGLYNDEGNNCTNGFGHLVHHGPCIQDDMNSYSQDYSNGMTKGQAEQLLLGELSSVANEVSRLVIVPLNQNQFDALVSFQFNTGGLENSTLLKDINSGNTDPQTIAIDFGMWNKVTVEGQLTVSDGLSRRRASEAAMFSNGTYDSP